MWLVMWYGCELILWKVHWAQNSYECTRMELVTGKFYRKIIVEEVQPLFLIFYFSYSKKSHTPFAAMRCYAKKYINEKPNKIYAHLVQTNDGVQYFRKRSMKRRRMIKLSRMKWHKWTETFTHRWFQQFVLKYMYKYI